MASDTARSRRGPTRQAGGTPSLAARLQRISPAGWIALGACVVALVLASQTTQGQGADYDEGVYWQSLRAMAIGHPLFSSIFSSQPPLFLLSIFPFYMAFGQSLSAARLGLVAFSVAGVAGTFIAGHALKHRMVGAVASLLLALDPLYEHGAHTLQAELPSVALQIWAVALAVLAMRATGRRRGWLAVATGVLLGCALLTKLFAIAALIPVLLYLIAPLARRFLDTAGRPIRPDRAAVHVGIRQIAPTLGLLAAGCLGMVILVLLPFAGHIGTVYDQTVRFHLAAAETNSHPLRENVRLIITTLLGAPLLYTALLAALVLIWKRAQFLWASVPLLAWALADFITLARQQPLLEHHVVLLSPSLALIAGCGACLAWQPLTAPGKQRAQLAVTLLALVLACGAGLAVNIRNNAIENAPLPTRTLEMALALQSVSAPDEVVLSDDQYVAALANRDVPPPLVDTSAVRITSGYLTATQLEDYLTRSRVHVILFASGRFDLLPGFRAWVAQRYTQVATFDHHGTLYLLEPNNNNPV